MKKVLIALFATLLMALGGQYVFLQKQAQESIYNSILKATQDSNATVTRLFINSLYPSVESVLKLTDPAASETLLSESDFQIVDTVIRKFVFGTDVLKVKIYTPSGLTKYSSDLSQVGEDKSENTGFLSALRGVPGSQISHRGVFSAMEGELFERDLVASYIPIRDRGNAVIGVAELYTDRTPALKQAERQAEELQFVLILAICSILLIATGIFWSAMLSSRRS